MTLYLSHANAGHEQMTSHSPEFFFEYASTRPHENTSNEAKFSVAACSGAPQSGQVSTNLEGFEASRSITVEYFIAIYQKNN